MNTHIPDDVQYLSWKNSRNGGIILRIIMVFYILYYDWIIKKPYVLNFYGFSSS
jgi:hypothetical protein